MDLPKFGSNTTATTDIEFLQEIQQSMLIFHSQLAELSRKVTELDQQQTKLAIIVDNDSKVSLQEQSSIAPSSVAVRVGAGAPPVTAPHQQQPHFIPTPEIVRLDGRIDLLNGKINLVKHEVSQLILLGNQQQQQQQSSSSGGGGWDPASTISGAEEEDGAIIDLGPGAGLDQVKAEPEFLLNVQFTEGDDDEFLRGADGLDFGEEGDEEEEDDEFEDDEDDDGGDKDFKPTGGPNKSSGLKSDYTDPACSEALQFISRNANGKFACPSCSVEVKFRRDLERHYAKHIGNKCYRCSQCNAVFNRKDNWLAHMKRKHTGTESGVPNLDCKPAISSKQLLNSIHMNPTTNKFHCPHPSCNKEFGHKNEVVRHYATHSGERPFSCKYCVSSFSRPDKLTTHMKAKHMEHHLREKMLDEQRAAAAASSTSSVRALLPKGEKKCPICHKIFSRREHAIRHLKTHSAPTTTELFKCVACPRSYSRKDKLRAHQREKHGKIFEPGDPYVVELEVEAQEKLDEAKKEKKMASTVLHECPECKKSFNQKSKLDRHIIGCRGLKPFSCEECGKSFTQKSALIQHRASIHQGVKRFLCAECGSCFYGSTNYKKHVRTHTGVKPYPCSVCGRHFNGRSDLKRHERIHEGVRNFHCTQCDLKFIRRDALAKHQLVHTGEKPWMCDLCGSSFSQSGSMKKHRETCAQRMSEGKRLSMARKPRTPILSAGGLGPLGGSARFLAPSPSSSSVVSSVCEYGSEGGGNLMETPILQLQPPPPRPPLSQISHPAFSPILITTGAPATTNPTATAIGSTTSIGIGRLVPITLTNSAVAAVAAATSGGGGMTDGNNTSGLTATTFDGRYIGHY